MKMRNFIDAVALMEDYDSEGMRRPDGFIYFSNCTDVTGVGPYLDDMFENGKQITYRKFMAAVGEYNVRPVFSDYEWGRGRDLKMRNDPYVSYYQSTFRGLPCYYIRQSGIEWVFIRPGDYDAAISAPEAPKKKAAKKTIVFMPDGTVTDQAMGQRSSVRATIVKGTIRLEISHYPEPIEAKAVLDYLSKNPKLRVLWDDDEDADSDEVISYFRAAANKV
jgi:hypothetical protein